MGKEFYINNINDLCDLMCAPEVDNNIMRYIPKKYHNRIEAAWIEYEVDYNPKTGKLDNRYYIVIDGEEHFFNNIKHMIDTLKYEY